MCVALEDKALSIRCDVAKGDRMEKATEECSMKRDAALYFRDQFRAARARALHDAEAYNEVLFSIERFGSALTKKVGTLATYGNEIKNIAKTSPLAEEIPGDHRDWHVPFPDLYEVVRDARNDALHQGASARHLTANATQLVLILEDALNENNAINVGHYVVRDPLCAFPWQPISLVRQQMLANNFSYLPFWNEQAEESAWQFISDYTVADYLRSAPSKNGEDGRKVRLAKTVEEALDSPGFDLTKARHCYSDTSVQDALKILDGSPVLVIVSNSHERLVGILISCTHRRSPRYHDSVARHVAL
jgi:hypothetical protein